MGTSQQMNETTLKKLSDEIETSRKKRYLVSRELTKHLLESTKPATMRDLTRIHHDLINELELLNSDLPIVLALIDHLHQKNLWLMENSGKILSMIKNIENRLQQDSQETKIAIKELKKQKKLTPIEKNIIEAYRKKLKEETRRKKNQPPYIS